MKVSVSLPKEDVDFVDEYAAREGLPSRSSVIHEALRLLRLSDLERDYTRAWEEWESSPEADGWDNDGWDNTVGDGLDASR
ncbi:ribbon-helix-helix domain-containing protein [Thermasporomyces composti]|jgi:Arc/MetJ-type ribon-helix-helix transcriptional regulator|uniref:Ribbon-helix-helix CopG family protein n=1 Tax=Thermasporomyces composti TaxID=696763 RepID=A0A3D9V7E6_THECX|nr:ribbon-helix-helix domain-containing protein [Thermasporomyces composti]REF36623.1 ribbon-helix-helix CopG family protein [Thermasporomyces composti]